MVEEFIPLFRELASISVEAGQAVMNVYNGDFGYELKSDESPITAADRAAHEIITEALTGVEVGGRTLPVLSEEGAEIPFEERRQWDSYWLVDPLDGTKEFISRNGEFTVNIALIGGSRPRLGMVYLPVTEVLYFGGRGLGSFRTPASDLLLARAERLPLGIERDPDVLTAAGSRSHRSDRFDRWIESEAEKRGCSRVEVITAGSSLKFCLAAEGRVDVYPRFGPTMEWDTAAAQAVAEGAGRSCTDPEGRRLEYNKPDMRNNGFIVR